MRYHQDNRGMRYCDVFPAIGKGDINITVVQPGAAALWHRHKYQNDFQFVVKGALQIGICNMPNDDRYVANSVFDLDKIDKMQIEWRQEYREIFMNAYCQPNENVEYSSSIIDFVEKYKNEPHCNWEYYSEHNAHLGPLFIPAGLWHGCYNFTNKEAVLVYHITKKYEILKPDEERCSPELMGWDYERKAK